MNKTQHNDNFDYEIYKQLINLWTAENRIKTQKLQFLLLGNTLLVVGACLNTSPNINGNNWPIYLCGSLFSFVWLLSIGRTVWSQKVWAQKIKFLINKNHADNRFTVMKDLKTFDGYNPPPLWLRVFGGVSSKYYLIATPLALLLIWSSILIHSID